MGKSSINGPFSMAMLNNQRIVDNYSPTTGLGTGQNMSTSTSIFWDGVIQLHVGRYLNLTHHGPPKKNGRWSTMGMDPPKNGHLKIM